MSDENEYDGGEELYKIMNSLARITLAGFGGAMIGLNHQKRDAESSRIFLRSTSGATGSSPNIPSHGRIPPALSSLRFNQQRTNLPLTWSISFMAFVCVIETARLNSPTTSLLTLMDGDKDGGMKNKQLQAGWLGNPQSFITVSDYVIGGAVAGFAGSMAKRPPPPSSSSTSKLRLPSSVSAKGGLPLVLSGVGTGICLGLLAGVSQMMLDIADSSARQQPEQEETQQQHEQQQ